MNARCPETRPPGDASRPPVPPVRGFHPRAPPTPAGPPGPPRRSRLPPPRRRRPSGARRRWAATPAAPPSPPIARRYIPAGAGNPPRGAIPPGRDSPAGRRARRSCAPSWLDLPRPVLRETPHFWWGGCAMFLSAWSTKPPVPATGASLPGWPGAKPTGPAGMPRLPGCRGRLPVPPHRAKAPAFPEGRPLFGRANIPPWPTAPRSARRSAVRANCFPALPGTRAVPCRCADAASIDRAWPAGCTTIPRPGPTGCPDGATGWPRPGRPALRLRCAPGWFGPLAGNRPERPRRWPACRPIPSGAAPVKSALRNRRRWC